MRTRRTEWAERVARWRRSGLTAKQFAASIGVNPANLTQWAWRLGREPRSGAGGSAPSSSRRAEFVEIVTGGLADGRFEVELSNGRRLHVPASFEATALERLLAVLEAAR